MMKKFIKTAVAGFMYYSGLLRFFVFLKKITTGACIVLTYHRVIPPEDCPARPEKWECYRSLPGIVVSPEMFAEQIEFIVKRYNVIPLMDLVGHLERGEKIPRRSAVITFDDGWRDNFVYAFPVLKKYRVPATIFLTTGFIGTTRLFWPERLISILTRKERANINTAALPDGLIPARAGQLIETAVKCDMKDAEHAIDELVRILKYTAPDGRDRLIEQLQRQVAPDQTDWPEERVMLDWDEVKTMHESGISFGSHGVNHEILTAIANEQQYHELDDSKKAMDDHLPSSLPVFVYPNGDYDKHVQELAKTAGYRCAFGVEPGLVRPDSDPFALKRLNVHEHVGKGPAGGFSPALFCWYLEGLVY